MSVHYFTVNSMELLLSVNMTSLIFIKMAHKVYNVTLSKVYIKLLTILNTQK